MKYLITGVSGQLGYDVVRNLIETDNIVIGTSTRDNYQLDFITNEVKNYTYHKLDITDEKKVRKLLKEINPDVIIHCAAWTNVDNAEAPENKEKVYDINVNGTKYLAEISREIDSKFLYISTDYVFDGKGNVPWDPDNKNYCPLNYYGKTKLMGEKVVSETLSKYFIIRIAWVFGKNGNNFIKTISNVGRKFDEIKVVNDQVGLPTYTYDLSKLLIEISKTEKYGYYHATNEGEFISWYDFTLEIFKQQNIKTKVIPVSSEEYGLSIAKRPMNSRMNKSKLTLNGFSLLPDWQNALSRFLDEIN